MNQMEALESLQSELERKAEEFNEAKSKSVEGVKNGIQELKKLMEFMENSIISEIEEAFEVNRFAAALGKLSELEEGASNDELERIREVARIRVVPKMGPCKRDFLKVQERIIGLGNWSGEKPLNVPTHVEGRSCGADSVEVVWDSVENAMGYHVEMRRPNEGAFQRVYEGSETRYRVSGLCSGTRLLFRVRNVLENGSVSDWSECVEACSASCGVQYLCAEAVSESEIVVSWDPIDVPEGGEAPKYHVEMRPKNQEEGENPKFQEIYCGNETMCSAAGLKSEEEHLFTVRTMCGDRCISRSCIVTARTKIAAPKRLHARTDKWNSINLSWCSVPSKLSDWVNYIVEMRKGDSEFAEIYRGERTKIKKSEIEDDTEYSFRVRAVVNREMSEWSEVASVKTQKLPDFSNEVTAAHNSWNGIKLSWEGASKAEVPSTYIVEMKEEGNTSSKFTEIYRGPDENFIKSNLKQDKEYSFRVRSLCNDKGSKWSGIVKFRTEKILAPSDFSVKGFTCNSISLTWKGADETESYQIEANGKELNDKINSSTFTHNGLSSNTEYTFRVRAVRGNEEGEWSDYLKVRTEIYENTWKECPDDVDKERRYTLDVDNPKIATSAGKDYCTIVRNGTLAPETVTSWNIKILKSAKNNGVGIYIGVAPSDIDQNVSDNYSKCGWYLHCHGLTLYSGPHHNRRYMEYGSWKAKFVQSGDTVGVVMDTTKGELSFVVDGVNLGAAYTRIPLDKPLVSCVLLYQQGDSIELMV